MSDRNKLGRLSRELKESDCTESSRRQLLAVFSSPGEEELISFAKLFSEFILFEHYSLQVKVNALWLMIQIIRQDRSGKAARQFAPKIYLFLTKCWRNLLDDETVTTAVIALLLQLQQSHTYCDSFIEKLFLAGGKEFNEKIKKTSQAILFQKYSKLELVKLRTVRKVPLANQLFSNYSMQSRIGLQDVVDKQEQMRQGSLTLREALAQLEVTKKLLSQHMSILQGYEHFSLELFDSFKGKEVAVNPKEGLL